MSQHPNIEQQWLPEAMPIPAPFSIPALMLPPTMSVEALAGVQDAQPLTIGEDRRKIAALSQLVLLALDNGLLDDSDMARIPAQSPLPALRECLNKANTAFATKLTEIVDDFKLNDRESMPSVFGVQIGDDLTREGADEAHWQYLHFFLVETAHCEMDSLLQSPISVQTTVMACLSLIDELLLPFFPVDALYDATRNAFVDEYRELFFEYDQKGWLDDEAGLAKAKQDFDTQVGDYEDFDFVLHEILPYLSEAPSWYMVSGYENTNQKMAAVEAQIAAWEADNDPALHDDWTPFIYRVRNIIHTVFGKQSLTQACEQLRDVIQSSVLNEDDPPLYCGIFVHDNSTLCHREIENNVTMWNETGESPALSMPLLSDEQTTDSPFDPFAVVERMAYGIGLLVYMDRINQLSTRGVDHVYHTQ